MQIDKTVMAELMERLPSLLAAVVIFCIFYFIGVAIHVLLKRIQTKSVKAQKPIFQLFSYINRFLWLAIGIITALGSIGIDVSALVAGLGLSGLAASFAMKDMLSNMIAGINILLYQPFAVGHHIEIKGIEGRVSQINLRYTCLKNEQFCYLIPNASLLTEAVKVWDKDKKNND